jgi:hypothetical protein
MAPLSSMLEKDNPALRLTSRGKKMNKPNSTAFLRRDPISATARASLKARDEIFSKGHRP